MSKFKENDKVVILDASKISQAESLGFKSGVEYKVCELFHGRPVLEHPARTRYLYFYEKELKYIKKVEDEKMAKFNKGDKIVLTNVDVLEGTKRGSLTKNKEYEVVRYEEKNDARIEHFVIIDNFGKEFVVADYEFKYVSIAEDKEKMVENVDKLAVGKKLVRIAETNTDFENGKSYEIIKSDYISVSLLGEKGSAINYSKDRVLVFFEFAEDAEYEFSVGGEWLESLIKYFEPVQELTLDQKLKEKDEFIEQLLHKIKVGEEEYTALSKEYREFREAHTLLPVQLLCVNQQRKLIIEESRLTYDVWINEIADGGKSYAQVYNRPEQRKCTIILRDRKTDKVISKGIAQCRRNDVYNSHLGYVIALGKAMDKDVNRFMNAVQPELALGQMVKVKEGVWRPRRIKGKADGESNTLDYLKKLSKGSESKLVKITSDTNAQY